MLLISTLPTRVIEHLNPQFLIYGYEVICKCTLDMPIMVIFFIFFVLYVFLRFGLIRDGEVDKIFKTRSPESICEGSSFSTEADLGRLTDVQELIIKVIILIYSYE